MLFWETHNDAINSGWDVRSMLIHRTAPQHTLLSCHVVVYIQLRGDIGQWEVNEIAFS